MNQDGVTLESGVFSTSSHLMLASLRNISQVSVHSTRRTLMMAWYCSGSTNSELVENLFKANLIKNGRVKEAMLGVSSIVSPPPQLTLGQKEVETIEKDLITNYRLIEATMLHHGPIRTLHSPLGMEPLSQHLTCMATRANISLII